MISLFVVWTPASIVAAIVGGALVGLLLISRFDNPRFDARESAAVVALLGSFAGLVFWSALFSDGPTNAWRVVSRFGLFLLFIVAMGIGTGIGVRRERGSWRA